MTTDRVSVSKNDLRNLLHPELCSTDLLQASRQRIIEDESIWKEFQQPAAQRVDHPDDIAVDNFSAAMKAKMAKKRAQGRGGWEDKERCSGESLSRMLVDHIPKGDPVDVANFAMMLHQRGQRIIVPQPTPSAVGEPIVREFWIVVDEFWNVQFAGDYERVCHEHINESIDAGIPMIEASKWKVRKATYSEAPAVKQSLTHDFLADVDKMVGGNYEAVCPECGDKFMVNSGHPCLVAKISPCTEALAPTNGAADP